MRSRLLHPFRAHPGTDVGPRRRIHALLFAEPERTLLALRRLVADGYHIVDVHSPFPLHGVEEVIGLPRTRLPVATLIGGLVGLATAALLQIWTHAVDWPLIIGGKSLVALPALIPIGFELTVLFAAFATVAALFVRARLYPRIRRGTPAIQPHPAATDDRFVVLVSESDAGFVLERLRPLAVELGALQLDEGWRVL